MSQSSPLLINCRTHGNDLVSAVVCGHMINSSQVVGFVENSDDPNNFQAWCEDCEEAFLREGDKTEAFLAFNRMTLVCFSCYQELRSTHSREFST